MADRVQLQGLGVRARRVLLAALTAFTVMALIGAGSAHAAFRGANGKVAFDYQEVGDTGDGPGALTSLEIWTQTPGLDDRQRLTTNDAADSDPTWSADGRQIAFVSDRTGTSQIWVMRADGSGQRQITHAADGATAPTWSPSGLWLAYVSDGDIWTITVFGILPYHVTRTADVVESSPAWSPNGQRIAYTAQAPGETSQIWSARFDGRQVVDLSAAAGDSAFNDLQPDWSPDGSSILYQTSNGQGGGYGDAIYRMNANGTDPTVVIPNEYHAGADGAVYSPDGHAIATAFGEGLGGGILVRALGPDGTLGDDLGDLGPTPDGYLYNPSWQPVRAAR